MKIRKLNKRGNTNKKKDSDIIFEKIQKDEKIKAYTLETEITIMILAMLWFAVIVSDNSLLVWISKADLLTKIGLILITLYVFFELLRSIVNSIRKSHWNG